MGGGAGGAVRAAAKIAGVGVFNGGIRGMPVVPPAEQSVRNATGPVSAVLSSSSNTPSTEVSSIPAVWNDWEFTDDELKIQAGEPMPRVVFGGVPSFQEAKEATTELKDALDKVYLSSPKSTGFGDSFAADHVSALSPLTSPELDSKSCVVSEATLTPVKKNALQAFEMLRGSPEVQTVAASIASDPNVWNAVMHNDAMKDYLTSQQGSAHRIRKSLVDDVIPSVQSPTEFEASYNRGQTGKKENWFARAMGMMNIKPTVTGMVSNVSNYFKDIFGFLESDDSSSSSGNGRSEDHHGIGGGGGVGGGGGGGGGGGYGDAAKTFMSLVLLVMMVVVLKRV